MARGSVLEGGGVVTGQIDTCISSWYNMSLFFQASLIRKSKLTNTSAIREVTKLSVKSKIAQFFIFL